MLQSEERCAPERPSLLLCCRMRRKTVRMSTLITIPFGFLVIITLFVVLVTMHQTMWHVWQRKWDVVHQVQMRRAESAVELRARIIASAATIFTDLYPFTSSNGCVEKNTFAKLCGILKFFDPRESIRTITAGEMKSTRTSMCGSVQADKYNTSLFASETVDGISGEAYLVNQSTLNFIQPLVPVTLKHLQKQTVLDALRESILANTGLIDRYENYLRNESEALTRAEKHLRWNISGPFGHIMQYTIIFPLASNMAKTEHLTMEKLLFVSVRFESQMLLTTSLVDFNNSGAHVMMLDNYNEETTNPVVLANNWGKRLKVDTMIPNTPSGSPLRLNDLEDPLMQEAIKQLKPSLFSLNSSNFTRRFKYRGSLALATASNFQTPEGLSVLLVLVSPTYRVNGPVYTKLIITVTCVSVGAVVIIVVFWFLMEYLFTRPLRRIAQALRSQESREIICGKRLLEIVELAQVADAHNAAMAQLREVDTFMPYLPTGQRTWRRQLGSHSSDSTFNPLLGKRGSRDIRPESTVMELVMTVMCIKVTAVQRIRNQRAPTLQHNDSDGLAFETPESVEEFIGLVMRLSERFSGHIHCLTPESVIVHFFANAIEESARCGGVNSGGSSDSTPPENSQLHDDALNALRFALRMKHFYDRKDSPMSRITIMIDTAMFTYAPSSVSYYNNATHGASGRNMGHQIGYILPLIGVQIGMTEETALLVRGDVRQLPLEVLYISGSGGAPEYPVVLYAALPGPASTALWKRFFAEFSNGFYYMLRGDYFSALEVFDDLQSELGLNDPREERAARAEVNPTEFAELQRMQCGIAQLERLMERCRERIMSRDTDPYVRRPMSSNYMRLMRAPLANRASSQPPRRRDMAALRVHRQRRRTAPQPVPAESFDVEGWSKKLYVAKVPLLREIYFWKDVPLVVSDSYGIVWRFSSTPLGERDTHHQYNSTYAVLSPNGTLATTHLIVFRWSLAEGTYPEVHPTDATLSPETGAALLQDPLIVGCKQSPEQMAVSDELLAPGLRSPYLIARLGVSRDHFFGVVLLNEFYPGGNLNEMLSRYGALLPLVAVHKYMVHVLLALSFLHSRGIVHGRLTPCSILVGMDGRCKIASYFGNFNRAKRLFVLKTSCYMSPEVARGQEESAASDLYCVGLILLRVLVGKGPWKWSPTALAEGGDCSEAALEKLQKDSGEPFREALGSGKLLPVSLADRVVSGDDLDTEPEPSSCFKKLLRLYMRSEPTKRGTAQKGIGILTSDRSL